MKLLKSRSFGSFQSGIMGFAGLITHGSSIIAFESKLVKESKVYMDLVLKSMGSSIIIGSEDHVDRVSADGSKAPELMKFGDTMGASCLIGVMMWDCLGNGLSIGGVGGALTRAKGSTYGIDFVVGVPPYEEPEEEV
jgi:hypothetical protein